MSRILRRPMFRGGSIDSRGSGITSGLGYASGGRVGYQGGGQIGGGSIYGTPMADGRYGFAEPKSFDELQSKERKKQDIRNNMPYLSEVEIENLYQQKQKNLEDTLSYGMGVEEEGPGTFMESTETDLRTLTSPGGKKLFISEQIAKSKEKEKELLEKGLIDKPIITGTQIEIDVDAKRKQEELNKLKNINNNQKTSSNQFEEYFREYLPVIQEQLKPDSDASKRAKFLELAKVGLGILSQPGGQTLGETVGKAATPSITNLQKLMAQDEQSLQAPKLLALQAAIKRMDGPSATELGIKGKRIQEISENLVSNYGLFADPAYKVANKLDDLREKNSKLAGKFNTKKPEQKDLPKKGKHYYFTEEGELTIFDGDKQQFFSIEEIENIS